MHMERLSLAARLKKRAHREVASAQDVMLAEAYGSFNECVLHGGAAIWRCYGGGRFSEVIDVYLPGYTSAAGLRFRSGLASKGMTELKFKAPESTVFGKFQLGGAIVSFEAALRQPPGRIIAPYETLGGGQMLVATLSPDDLLVEKSKAYVARRKVRDLYDVFFLLTLVPRTGKIREAINAISDSYGPPVDEGQLKATILAGAVPSAEEMIEGIRGWARKST
jgi:predicted nucleotidyltransferase component of viral defense system